MAWLTYFVSTGLASAAVPTSVSAVLAGGIVVVLARLDVPVRRAATVALGWGAVLALAHLTGGPVAVGGVLTVAFVLQVVPSVRQAWTSQRATGVSRPTWLLIAAEVSCWGTIGLVDGRPPLVFLFATGVTASMLMLWLTRPSGPRGGGIRQGLWSEARAHTLAISIGAAASVRREQRPRTGSRWQRSPRGST